MAVGLAVMVGCTAPPLPEGREVQAQWLISASEVVSRLDIPCADAVGGTDRYEVLVDDYSGRTLLVEPGAGRVWIRDPFGVVPSRCWGLPPGPQAEILPTTQPCVDSQGLQDGSCTAATQLPAGWTWRAPGVVWGGVAGGTATRGVFYAPGDDQVERLDLTVEVSSGVEGLRSHGGWLPPVADVTGTELAAARGRLIAWDGLRGRVRVVDDPARSDEGRSRGARSGPGVVRAADDVAAVVTPAGVDVFTDLGDRLARSRRSHPVLRDGIIDAVVTADGAVHALVDGGVVGLLDDGRVTWHPTPGAAGVALAHPGDQDLVLAWGPAGVWRLEPENTAVFHAFDEEILGLGVGDVFQEVVVVTAAEGAPSVRGWIDADHLARIPDGTVGLALAAFAESPNDAAVVRIQPAEEGLDKRGGCGEAPEGVDSDTWTICCAQAKRGELLDAQLTWLVTRRLALVLGVNPSVVAQSRLCAAEGLVDLAATVPDALRAWGDDDGALAAFVYSTPDDRGSGWVACPDRWDYREEAGCEADPDDPVGFYQALVTSLALGDPEPDWLLVGGGYGGVPATGEGGGWPTIFPALALPDGPPANGLYFGAANMAPTASLVALKEAAPSDASRRPFPVGVGEPADHWWAPGVVTGTYYPGQTVALPWLAELSVSGLSLVDFRGIRSARAPWSTELFRGAEDQDRVTHADFALEAHYLVARVLAHRDTATPRWWYMHLGDVTRLRAQGVHEGWIDCNGSCAEGDTELDRFLERVADIGPAVVWQDRP